MAVLNTQTTDEQGKATLEATISTVGEKTFTVTESTTNASKQVNVDVINVDRIDISLSEEIVSDGADSIVTAIAYSNDVIIPNLLIHVDGEDYVTDADGKATHIYEGSSQGLYMIEASCGSYVSSVQLKDVYQYFSQADNREYNLWYSTVAALSVLRKYNGIELSNSPSTYGEIYFIYPNSRAEDWRFQFKIVSITKNSDMMVCGKTLSYDVLKSKPTVIVDVVQSDTPVQVISLKNGDSVTEVSRTYNTYYFTPMITLNPRGLGYSTPSRIVIDELLIYKTG